MRVSFMNINMYFSEHLCFQYGVKSHSLSPSLFDLYIDDMVEGIKESCDGIQSEHFKVCSMLYAGDIDFILESPAN